jgi:hypothetical protein
MTPTDKQNLWDAIFKLRNMPYTGSGYPAYNNVKNPALRGGLYYWTQRDMINLFNELVLYCESGESGACWKVLLGYKTKIYPAYLRKIYQTLNCTPVSTCPAIGDAWHGGTVFYIDGNDYYVVSSSIYDTGNYVGCTNLGFMGTQNIITESYNNTVLLSNSPCGPGNLAEQILLPITENGYSDWFIPSIFALQAIYDLRPGLLPSQLIWSSTEQDPISMFIFDGAFGSGRIWPKQDSGPYAVLIRKETCI